MVLVAKSGLDENMATTEEIKLYDVSERTITIPTPGGEVKVVIPGAGAALEAELTVKLIRGENRVDVAIEWKAEH